MGQRHQLFVIAKINGRYRCVCAIHHQWLYGHTALRRCLDVLNNFQDPTNRMPIEQELIAAAARASRLWKGGNPKDDSVNGKDTPEDQNGHGLELENTTGDIEATGVTATGDDATDNSNVQFPFIATCLIRGASFGLNGYLYKCSIEAFGMAYDQGITIFDITDLSHVKYCFVDFHGMESDRQVPLMTPLSAREYVEAYYVLSDPEVAFLLPLVETFKDWKLISADILADTWPDGEWFYGSWEESENGSDTERQEPGDVPDAAMMSLRDRSMDTLLQSLLEQNGCDPQLMAEAELLTDFIPKLRKKFYEQAGKLRPSPFVIDLLCRALEHDIEVNLSPFITLSVDDLSLTVSKLREHGKMTTLNLSNRPDVDEANLSSILGTDRAFKALCLLNNSHLSLEFVSKTFTDCDIYHTGLLRRPFKLKPSYWSEDPPVNALPFSANNHVTQIVWIGVESHNIVKPEYRMEDGRTAWDKYKIKFGDSESYRDGFLLHAHHRLDIPMPPSKTAYGLLRMLQWATPVGDDGSSRSFRDWPNAAAFSLAFSSPRTDGTGHGVGPIDGRLYIHDRWSDRGAKGPIPALKAGEWAILIVEEASDASDQEYLEKRFSEQRRRALRQSKAQSKEGEENTSAANSGPGETTARSHEAGEATSAKVLEPKETTGQSNEAGGATSAKDPGPKETTGQSNEAGLDTLAKVLDPKDSITHVKDLREICPRKGLKYALVTPVASSKTFEVVDVPMYVSRVLGKEEAENLSSMFTKGLSALPTVEFFGHEDNHLFVQKLFPADI